MAIYNSENVAVMSYLQQVNVLCVSRGHRPTLLNVLLLPSHNGWIQWGRWRCISHPTTLGVLMQDLPPYHPRCCCDISRSNTQDTDTGSITSPPWMLIWELPPRSPNTPTWDDNMEAPTLPPSVLTIVWYRNTWLSYVDWLWSVKYSTLNNSFEHLP